MNVIIWRRSPSHSIVIAVVAEEERGGRLEARGVRGRLRLALRELEGPLAGLLGDGRGGGLLRREGVHLGPEQAVGSLHRVDKQAPPTLPGRWCPTHTRGDQAPCTHVFYLTLYMDHIGKLIKILVGWPHRRAYTGRHTHTRTTSPQTKCITRNVMY